MFYCNKHLGMYEAVTFRYHDGILGHYFLLSFFGCLRNDLNCVEWDVKPCSTNFVVAGKLVYSKSEKNHCLRL